MSTEVRAFDYVNQPYETVRRAFDRDGSLELVRRATKAAAARGAQLIAALRIEIAGLEIQKDVAIDVGTIHTTGSGGASRTTVPLSWKATTAAGWFPVMEAELCIYPLSATETQLEIRGAYAPPLGALGQAIDAAVGHRIAEASVHRFATDIAARLRSELHPTA
jgi:hypothetical protein